MTPPARYRIELRGRISDRTLGPYLDEFAITRTPTSTTLAGNVRDPAHLHGLISHLTSIGIELIGLEPTAAERSLPIDASGGDGTLADGQGAGTTGGPDDE